ncbi:MAG TPA: inverse autotransporter beta domain-containing protein, partial [Planctomycetaceae bacterium]|nr:inverse autotransporter beta domain-containing protein [Planctomycetaceae bacterium]
MNMTRVRVCCAIMLSWSLAAGPAFAQQPVPVPAADPAPGFAVVPPANSSVYIPFDPLNTRWNLQTDVGNAIGWNSGFQTFSGFIPITIEQGRSIIFVDARLWAGFNNNIGNNIGVGWRGYSPMLDRTTGVSAWWDHDDRHWASFDQAGISVESLGTVFDARANVYLPNSSQKILSQHLTGQAFCLQGFNIGLGQSSQVAAGLSGADAEIGGALPLLGDFGIRNYIGTYYYQGGSNAFWGVRQRNEVLITENVQGQVSVTSDPVFGTNVFGAVNIMLPSGKPARAFSRQPTYERLYVPVQRDYRVHVQSYTDNSVQLARRAGGQGGSGGPVGTPIVVWHVDNTAPAGGNGSEAHPFNFLPTTTPGNVDMILVARGDGTVTNMNHG